MALEQSAFHWDETRENPLLITTYRTLLVFLVGIALAAAAARRRAAAAATTTARGARSRLGILFFLRFALGHDGILPVRRHDRLVGPVVLFERALHAIEGASLPGAERLEHDGLLGVLRRHEIFQFHQKAHQRPRDALLQVLPVLDHGSWRGRRIPFEWRNSLSP